MGKEVLDQPSSFTGLHSLQKEKSDQSTERWFKWVFQPFHKKQMDHVEFAKTKRRD